MIVNNDIYTGEDMTLETFEDAKRRIAKKEQDIKDLENELYLLKLQALNTYKKAIVYFFPTRGNNVTMARNWLKMIEDGTDLKGKKLDKRRRYEEKESYDAVNSYISNVLGAIIAVTNIVDYNYGQATIFEFYHEGEQFRLLVPNVDLITLKAFEYEGEEAFKLSLSVKDSECSTKVIGSTFNDQELTDIMNKYLENGEQDG